MFQIDLTPRSRFSFAVGFRFTFFLTVFVVAVVPLEELEIAANVVSAWVVSGSMVVSKSDCSGSDGGRTGGAAADAASIAANAARASSASKIVRCAQNEPIILYAPALCLASSKDTCLGALTVSYH
jgi:hypothetical protein